MRLVLLLMVVTASLVMAPLAAVLAADDKAEPADPKAPKAREIDTKGMKLPTVRGGLDKPTKVTSAADLAKLVPDEDAQKAITKNVDFKKEYLVVFAWSGSGGDKVSFETKKGKEGEEAVFTYKRGLTRDLRGHFKVFALPNKTTYNMAK